MSSVFLINIVVITFSPRVIDTVKFVEVTFFYLRHFNIDYFTLHYTINTVVLCRCDYFDTVFKYIT